MVRHPATGDLLLTWSANLWETQAYATGLARCEGVLGPCRRTSEEQPWLRTSGDAGFGTAATFGGAGGLSFVMTPDDEVYALLHAYRGDGQAPGAVRTGWAFRVEASGPGGPGYRLVDIAGNHSAGTTVSGS
jgi:hypothetical protein